MFFAKYDLDNDNSFGSDEGLKILEDIDEDKLFEAPAPVKHLNYTLHSYKSFFKVCGLFTKVMPYILNNVHFYKGRLP